MVFGYFKNYWTYEQPSFNSGAIVINRLWPIYVERKYNFQKKVSLHWQPIVFYVDNFIVLSTVSVAILEIVY